MKKILFLIFTLANLYACSQSIYFTRQIRQTKVGGVYKLQLDSLYTGNFRNLATENYVQWYFNQVQGGVPTNAILNQYAAKQTASAWIDSLKASAIKTDSSLRVFNKQNGLLALDATPISGVSPAISITEYNDSSVLGLNNPARNYGEVAPLLNVSSVQNGFKNIRRSEAINAEDDCYFDSSATVWGVNKVAYLHSTLQGTKYIALTPIKSGYEFLSTKDWSNAALKSKFILAKNGTSTGSTNDSIFIASGDGWNAPSNHFMKTDFNNGGIIYHTAGSFVNSNSYFELQSNAASRMNRLVDYYAGGVNGGHANAAGQHFMFFGDVNGLANITDPWGVFIKGATRRNYFEGSLQIGDSSKTNLRDLKLYVNGKGKFTDTLTATTMGVGDSSNRVATTAYVKNIGAAQGYITDISGDVYSYGSSPTAATTVKGILGHQLPVSMGNGALKFSTTTNTWTWEDFANYAKYTDLNPLESKSEKVNSMTGNINNYNYPTTQAVSDFASKYVTNPMTTVGDLIMANTGGTPMRFAAGANGTYLSVQSGVPTWVNIPVANLSLTQTATQLNINNAGGTGVALPIFSTTAGLVPGTTTTGTKYLRDDGTWQAVTGGFVNPMTTAGDMIVGGASGAPTRLAGGTNGYMLQMVSGYPAWVNDSSALYVNAPLRKINDSTLSIDKADPVTDGYLDSVDYARLFVRQSIPNGTGTMTLDINQGGQAGVLYSSTGARTLAFVNLRTGDVFKISFNNTSGSTVTLTLPSNSYLAGTGTATTVTIPTGRSMLTLSDYDGTNYMFVQQSY